VNRLDEVLADLAAEGDRLEELVAVLDDAGWRTPTSAPGWTVAHQVAHLAWTDERALIAATDLDAWNAEALAATGDLGGFVDAAAEAGAAAAPRDLLVRWRSARSALAKTLHDLPEGTRLPWYGPSMSAASMATARFMETWAHSRDVADGLGVSWLPDDRVRHVVHLGIRTRDYAFAGHELEPPAEDFHVRLRLPGGELLSYGDPSAAQSVSGSAYDFALLVTQRMHRADTDLEAVGVDADRWLEMAQAFAGPTGEGRAARG